jgi:type I restriction enzyme S subunit
MAGGTSTSHQRVKPSDILNTPIIIPPNDVAHRADEFLKPIYRLSHDLLSANHTLAAGRDLLLPRLISGELSVAAAERALEDAA